MNQNYDLVDDPYILSILRRIVYIQHELEFLKGLIRSSIIERDSNDKNNILV